MEVVCYILKSHRGTYYCGITNYLLRRWKEHRSGKSKYTAKFGAKEVVYVCFFDSYDNARRKEIDIKRAGVQKSYIKSKFNSSQL